MIGGFGALFGGVLGNVAYAGLKKGMNTTAFKKFGSALKRATAPIGQAARTVDAAAAAKRTAKFTGTFGEEIASRLPRGFGTMFRPVPRAFPGSADNLVGAAKSAQEKMIQKSTNNLFMGVRMRKGAQAILGAGVVAGVAGKEALSEVRREAYNDPYSAEMTQAGEMPRASGDMIGSVQNGKRDLGATGDIVLALNKRRHG